ncbi:MAG: ion transporter [Clostridiales bacterium]|nr:ion transporter [Clostridiales bacterium]
MIIPQRNIRQKIFDLITKQENDIGIESIFNNFVVVLIVMNTIAVIIATFSNLPPLVVDSLRIFEIASSLFFTAEYFSRVITADFLYPSVSPIRAAFRYIFSVSAFIDLFSILPFYLPLVIPVDLRALRMLRLFRFLRVFKLNRYTESLQVILKVFKNKASELVSSVFIISVLIIIASALMYDIEHQAQPEVFTNFFTSVWWAVATLTTVGYGDIYPVTPLGKILSAIIAILGIGFVALPTGIISSGFIDELSAKKKTPNANKYCPHCGHKLDD